MTYLAQYFWSRKEENWQPRWSQGPAKVKCWRLGPAWCWRRWLNLRRSKQESQHKLAAIWYSDRKFAAIAQILKVQLQVWPCYKTNSEISISKTQKEKSWKLQIHLKLKETEFCSLSPSLPPPSLPPAFFYPSLPCPPFRFRYSRGLTVWPGWAWTGIHLPWIVGYIFFLKTNKTKVPLLQCVCTRAFAAHARTPTAHRWRSDDKS